MYQKSSRAKRILLKIILAISINFFSLFIFINWPTYLNLNNVHVVILEFFI